MTDEWRWFWASEYGRDSMLREEIGGLHSRLSQSAARSSRLSSQLAALTGSLEERLDALSVAFDAYVELGDVREQLAAYPDTTQIRREVRDALAAAAAGRTADPVDPRGLEYWLPYVTNAVLAIAAGRPDDVSEETARALSPDTDLFVVAACGVIGHGESVADRLPGLLVCDAVLTPAQVALWEAAVGGVFGDVLPGIEPLWQQQIAAGDVSDWVSWVRGLGAAGPVAVVSWVAGQVGVGAPAVPAGAAEPATPTVPSADDVSATRTDPRDALRIVVTDLAGQGLGQEVELIRRARELRARIEQPTGAKPPVDAQPADAHPVDAQAVGPTVPDVVRLAFAAAPVGSAAHTVLLSWIAPRLLQVVDQHQQALAVTAPVTETVSSHGQQIQVTVGGADAAQLGLTVAAIRSSHAVKPTLLYALGAAAVVLGVICVVLAVAGQAGGAFLLLVAALASAVTAVKQIRLHRVSDEEAESAVSQLQQRVTHEEAEVQRREQERQRQTAQVNEQAGRIRDRLAAHSEPAVSR